MSIGTVRIVTGMCCDAKGEESIYPQTGGLSSSAKFQVVYWRCVVVYFASSFRNNPNADHILLTNAEQVPDLGNFKTAEFLSNIGVKVVNLPFTYQPPRDYFEAFRSTFYKFDIVKYLKNNSAPNDICISLDSDCVWVNPVKMTTAFENCGLGTYDLYEPENKPISGLTRIEMQKIYEEIGYKVNEPPKYFGAELIAGRGNDIKRLSDEIDSIWEICLQRFAEGKSRFNTEEQMLSYIYNKEGYAAGTGNPYLKRIWTSPKLYTAAESDLALDVWHLPGEKGYGIKRLFAEITNPKSTFWTVPLGNQFAAYAGSYLGVPKPTPSKSFLDMFDNRMSGLQRRLSKVTSVLNK
jgi:hypothetical protein